MTMKIILLAFTLAGCASVDTRRAAYEAEHAAVWRDMAEGLDAERRGDHDAVARAVASGNAHLRRMQAIREGVR
jgi:hypothetical protein